MIEVVKQYDLNDKENKVQDKQPSGYARGPHTAKQEQEDDYEVDKKVYPDRYKITQHDNIRCQGVIRKRGQVSQGGRYQKTNITNKCHPGEKTY
jgi:hypothetical protein